MKRSPLSDDAVAALCAARHGDPFAVLGQHVDGGVWIRALLPGALSVTAIDDDGHDVLPLAERSPTGQAGAGFFEGHLPRRRKPFAYRLRVQWPGGEQIIDDPYRFPPLLGEADLWLLAEGTHQRPFERLGAHPGEVEGIAGTRFAVWAPGAARVSVVGDFNHWDGRRHPMRRRDGGVWEIFLPAVHEGAFYKYEILTGDGRLLPLKADPYGFAAELRPSTASRVHALPPPLPRPAANRAGEQLGEPLSIYEVHLPSWRRGEGGGFPDWRRLADTLLPYVAELGFTHLELLPVSEHPFDGSWGYQPLGLYAPSARFGEAEGLRDFVRRAHDFGLKVIADWVPAHFPDDAHGLGEFDGSALYEHADPREGRHRDWGTLIYNFGRPQVTNYLLGNALYWIERYGLDGLRVDAVASMLYRDYSRPANEWVPNIHGGRENLEAIGFLRRLNALLGTQVPDAATYAEESTAWPLVTRPPEIGGLGFHYKWNLGWMHDVLSYFALDPIHRKYHHHKLSFGLMYAFSENFVLPLSHDEVVHGKGSLLGKMAGDRWQKFANLRALYGFMWTHPGKKLLFMGGEIAQWREWNHDGELDWWLLDDPAHAGVMRLVGDLNRLYRECPPLHELDVSPEGFEWLLVDDADASVLAFMRRGRDPRRQFMVICNLTPVLRPDFRIGVPASGEWRERLNTDSQHYGGSNSGNRYGAVSAEAIPAQGRAWSVAALLPPLSTVIYEWNSPAD